VAEGNRILEVFLIVCCVTELSSLAAIAPFLRPQLVLDGVVRTRGAIGVVDPPP
jgi:hypothetical protein